MREWERQNPRHKLGSYNYSLQDYGWSAEGSHDATGQCDWQPCGLKTRSLEGGLASNF